MYPRVSGFLWIERGLLPSKFSIRKTKQVWKLHWDLVNPLKACSEWDNFCATSSNCLRWDDLQKLIGESLILQHAWGLYNNSFAYFCLCCFRRFFFCFGLLSLFVFLVHLSFQYQVLLRKIFFNLNSFSNDKVQALGLHIYAHFKFCIMILNPHLYVFLIWH